MSIRTFVLTFTLLLSVPLLARDKTDVIVMKNGDRFTCEIKRLDAGVLSVGLDYVDGTISVEWAKVAHLESTQLFVVNTQDGSVYTGKLKTADSAASQPVQIQIEEVEEKGVTLNRSQITRIGETSEEFWQRFNGAMNFGVNYSKGNQATQLSFGTQAQYLRERWAAQAAFNSNLSANASSTTSTRNELSLSGYHLLPWDNYFYEGLGTFLQSAEQGIKLQTTLGGGIGRFLKNTDRTSLAVIGGVAWLGTDYDQSAAVPQSQNIAAALIAAELKFFKFKKTNLEVTATLIPALSEPGRVFFSTNATYYLKLFSNLSWNASFYGNWDNKPPATFSGSDYGSTSGLSWTFGNK